MRRKFNFYIPKHLLDDLTSQAHAEGITLAEVVRKRLMAQMRPDCPRVKHIPRLSRGNTPSPSLGRTTITNNEGESQ